MGAAVRKLEGIKIGKESVYSLIRSHLVEFIGTALLAVVGIGGAVMGHLTVDTPSYDRVTLTGRAIANGLILSVMILNFGGISGAHFNPAVTLAFSLRGVFPWTKVLTYWAVQIGGGIAGAAIVRGIFPDNPEDDYLGRPLARYGWTTGLYVEILLTFVHILNILGTATRQQLIGTGTAFAVGAWVATSFLFTGPLSGAVLNPAIAFGAFVISGEWMYGWIYIVGEFAGSLLAIAVTWVIHPQVERVEKGVAEGAETEKDRHRGPEAA